MTMKHTAMSVFSAGNKNDKVKPLLNKLDRLLVVVCNNMGSNLNSKLMALILEIPILSKMRMDKISIYLTIS